MARATGRASLGVEPIDVARGEDGHGRTRAAADPHALVLKSDAGWPARALDPVLHVGDLHFHDYEHVDRTTLRFVVDDVRRLGVGDSVFVQYGEETRTRVRLGALVKTW
ncbi:MAG: hypothetical protein ACE37F_19590 [Nannocystaceae bacterium]|nr:hypothetical protein [bacterium]